MLRTEQDQPNSSLYTPMSGTLSGDGERFDGRFADRSLSQTSSGTGHRPAERMDGVGVSPAELAALVEGDIIPRLLLAHRGSVPFPSEDMDGEGRLDGLAVERLAASAIERDTRLLLAQVEGHLARGVGVQTLLVDLLGPAARRLGQWWEEDACDFVDVTMGLWRLQEVVHEVAGRIPGACAPRSSRTALFTSMPGDDHMFGSLVLEESFRNAGWVTRSARSGSARDIETDLRLYHTDLVALTVTVVQDTGKIREFVAAIRKASSNPEVAIMVGGWMFLQNSGLAADVGADGTAPDARSALDIAEQLVNDRTDASHSSLSFR